jgi:hypothetical protein
MTRVAPNSALQDSFLVFMWSLPSSSRITTKGGELRMGLLEIIAIILLIGWLGGFTFHVAGDMIHILLIAALAIFILRMFRHSRI